MEVMGVIYGPGLGYDHLSTLLSLPTSCNLDNGYPPSTLQMTDPSLWDGRTVTWKETKSLNNSKKQSCPSALNFLHWDCHVRKK